MRKNSEEINQIKQEIVSIKEDRVAKKINKQVRRNRGENGEKGKSHNP